jgi:hypothetical protein
MKEVLDMKRYSRISSVNLFFSFIPAALTQNRVNRHDAPRDHE